MNEKLINNLKKKGIVFAEKLTTQEIEKIELTYGVRFTKELKDFFSIALPVSNGFYNWRDFSIENIEYIKQSMELPFKELREYSDEIYWCDDWGEEIEDSEERLDFLENKIEKAPKLIPIYSHRYVPCYESKSNPIFSIQGSDVIYYGENLSTYLEIEFGIKDYSDLKIEKIVPVPFWSDLI